MYVLYHMVYINHVAYCRQPRGRINNNALFSYIKELSQLCSSSPCHSYAVRTLGTGGGAPARHQAAGASGQAVVMGKGQGADMAGGPDRGLQFQKHDVVVMVQMGSTDLVFGVGDRADHLPHLLAGLHTPQGMFAQVNSVPTVGAGRGWLGRRARPSSPIPASASSPSSRPVIPMLFYLNSLPKSNPHTQPQAHPPL